MHDILFKAIPAQINVDEAKGIVECFVSGIGNKDSVGDIVLPGAFEASLRRRKPRVVWGHDWNSPIGKVLEIYEVPNSDVRLPKKMRAAGIGGLFARVQFNLKSERGREAFASVAFFGEDQEWSIGYKTLDAVYDNERKANLLREVELYEVSPVLHGANQLTGTISIKSEKQDMVTSFGKSGWKMFDRAFAERIKEDYPEIWAKGGNIKGNDQYEILTRIAEQGGAANTDDQIKALELREAWVARHKDNFRLAGVIAQIKWLAVGSRGEDFMKRVVNDAIAKMKTKGMDWDDDEEDEMDEVMGVGMDDDADDNMVNRVKYGKKPSKEKLDALMMLLEEEQEKGHGYMGDDDDDDDDVMWRIRRLLGMKPGSRMMSDDDDDMMEPMNKPYGSRCGCGKSDHAATDEAIKGLTDSSDMLVKAGRVLSSSNMQKIMQAIDLLREVIAAGGREDIEMKRNMRIDGSTEDMYGLKTAIDPVLDFYSVDAVVSNDGILIKAADHLNEEDFANFSEAIDNVASHFDAKVVKSN